MTNFRSVITSTVPERSSVLIEVRLTDKLGLPVDPSHAWLALQAAFKDHPHLKIEAAKIFPDKEKAPIA